METLALTKKLVSIPSISGEENSIQDYLFDLLSNNFSPRRVRAGKSYNIVCDSGNGKGGVLLNSHIDTVPMPSDERRNSLIPKVSGGKLFGLGACDQKAGAAIHINSFVNLSEKAQGKIRLALVVEEENYSEGTYELAKRGLLKGGFSLALFSEPTDLSGTGKNPLLVVGCRGRVGIDVKISGQASHSAVGKGVNAIEEGAKFVLATRRIRTKKNPEMGRGSANIGSITGGNYSLSQPAESSFRLNWSTVLGETPDYCMGEMRRVLSDVRSPAEFTAEFIKRPTPPCLPFLTKGPIVEFAKAAFREEGISPKTLVFGSVFDGSITANLGKIPTLCIGPAGKNIHGAGEFVWIESIGKAERITKRTIMSVLAREN